MMEPKIARSTLPAWTGGGRLGGIWSQNKFKFSKPFQQIDKGFLRVPFLEQREHRQKTRANMDMWAGRQPYKPQRSEAPYPFYSTGRIGFNPGSFRQYLFRNAGLIPNKTGRPMQLRGTYDPSGHKGRFAFRGRNRMNAMGPFRPIRQVRKRK